jgi:hypothetical protein
MGMFYTSCDLLAKSLNRDVFYTAQHPCVLTGSFASRYLCFGHSGRTLLCRRSQLETFFDGPKAVGFRFVCCDRQYT